MSHPRSSRRRRKAENAQAVIEMAMVLPITLALVTGYVALMIISTTQAQLRSATTLAAQSAITAPVDDFSDSCQWAISSFLQTMYGPRQIPAYNCSSVNGYPGPITLAPVSTGWQTDMTLTCTDSGYFSGGSIGSRTDPVNCASSMRLDFSKTPVAWAFPFLSPDLSQSAKSIPEAFRQCNPSITPSVLPGDVQKCT